MATTYSVSDLGTMTLCGKLIASAVYAVALLQISGSETFGIPSPSQSAKGSYTVTPTGLQVRPLTKVSGLPTWALSLRIVKVADVVPDRVPAVACSVTLYVPSCQPLAGGLTSTDPPAATV